MNTWKNKVFACASSHSFAGANVANARKSVSRCSLAAALSMSLFAAPDFAAEAAPSNPQAQNWPVLKCDDTTGPGSLRYIANNAQSGDTIDFSQLPAACGMQDSTLTLTSGEIVLHQPSISLIGPPPGNSTVTLSSAGNSRVIKHQGYSPFMGALTIQDLRIVDGYVHEAGDTGGGCVYSDASVVLVRSSIAGCAAKSDTGSVTGGGVKASNGSVTLSFSTISGNTAEAGTNGTIRGGGLQSHALQAKYSQIENNQAVGNGTDGGGAWSATATILYSTVANNSSNGIAGGISIRGVTLDSVIRNSTFSGNHAISNGGAIFAHAANLHIFNSTIANNVVDYDHAGGLYVSTASSTEIESSIIAANASTPMAADADIYVQSGTLTGTSNAVMSLNVNPSGFVEVSEDPMLAPLAWIGGPTRTHSLLPGSPAIGRGNNSANLPRDQRGAGFLRTTGPMATVDVGAVQFDSRIFASDFDGFFL